VQEYRLAKEKKGVCFSFFFSFLLQTHVLLVESVAFEGWRSRSCDRTTPAKGRKMYRHCKKIAVTGDELISFVR